MLDRAAIAAHVASLPERFRPDREAGQELPQLARDFAPTGYNLELADTSTLNPLSHVLTDHNAQTMLIRLAEQVDAGQVRDLGVAVPSAELVRKSLEQQEKERKERIQRDQLLLLQLQRIDRQIAWHQGEIEKLQSDKGAIQSYLQKLESGEKPDLNPDGSLKDAALEEKIKSYEEKYGIKVDRSDPDAIRDLIRRMDGDIAGHQRKVGDLKSDQQKLEALRDMPPEQAAIEFERLRLSDGRRAADTALSQANDAQQLAIVERQNLDQPTTAFTAKSVAAPEGADLYGSEITLGGRTSGDLTVAFAGAVSQSQTDSTAPRIEERPEAATNQNNLGVLGTGV
ncbi:hypothetical protein [Citromicrobium sp. WPS32]|uniref:hypothetical protein n=1 Tax=Citromicrobium sp. WPS32 TaxID=1634517 RepID=UPI0006C92EF7|nr:hypothetical protein [Citromicrobium sp. WPS32]KPM17708.1 hypothetical protein WG75_00060 [Citromicrobium sp. WPS32]